MGTEKEINALELRKHFGELLDEVRVKKQTYIITENARPVAALVEVETYQELLKQPPPPTATSAASIPPPPKGPEDAFIEIYSKERIAEFLKEDSLKKTSA